MILPAHTLLFPEGNRPKICDGKPPSGGLGAKMAKQRNSAKTLLCIHLIQPQIEKRCDFALKEQLKFYSELRSRLLSGLSESD